MFVHALYVLNDHGPNFAYDGPNPEAKAYVIMEMPAAAAWMRIAGHRLFRIFKQTSEQDEATRSFLDGVDIPNASERWNSWRHRLEKISQDEKLDEECRVHAARALQSMEEAEASI